MPTIKLATIIVAKSRGRRIQRRQQTDIKQMVPDNEQEKTRVGAVRYLNTRPLVYGLREIAPQVDLRMDVPSRLADDLATGDLDVALIPSIEYFQNHDYRIVSDACIGCRGPVLSVKLFFRTEPSQVKKLALDEGSRTSATLAQILLKSRFGTTPELTTLPLGSSYDAPDADAVLLIGDRAIHSPIGRFATVWDLGDEWVRWAGLPFVFAMWVARADIDTVALETQLSQSRDAGTANLSQIAAMEAPKLGLTEPECLAYLRDNLHFTLGPDERRGLERFYELAAELRLAPKGVDLGFADCRTAG
ncbi:MAG: menaquinone biosynthesis protein [Pirellulales bacterium]|nr:menaquinone biosynthesis protein [Pirellulales bacterium]